MLNLFLDSQIWLDLYSFSTDDLTQFSKLHDMIDSDVNLYLTRQVVNEVDRNRENKIKDAMTSFNSLGLQFPNLCKGYEQYKSLESLYKNLKAIHKELHRQVVADIDKKQLYADKVIEKIFSKTEIIEIDQSTLDSAILRYKLGNPPGKENSYGDAINWEILLTVVPDTEDLFFVSFDRDFRSPLSDKQINSFLKKEWQEIKKSEIFFYTSLTMFFNEHIKDISLKAENKKMTLIDELRKSGSFASTHFLISRLNEITSWTEDQCIYLFEAADSNNQVYSIMSDDDVKTFFLKIFKINKDKILERSDFHWLLEKLDIEIENEFVTEEAGILEGPPF